MSRDVDVSVIVLAGGASRRLKQPKALVDIAGQTLIERVVERVSSLGTETIVVAGRRVKLPRLAGTTRVIEDPVPLQGPATGIRNGLASAKGELCFVTSCDQPFPSVALARHLIAAATGWDAVIPRWEGYLQPLFAVYRRAVEKFFRERIASGELGLLAIVNHLRFREIDSAEIERFDPEGLSFVDVDTPAALAHALRLVAEGK